MNQKKIGILLSYGNIIITIITNLIYTPIMLKILGQSEYGIYTLSSSLVGYFSLLYAGLSSTYMRYYFRYKKDNDKGNIYKLNGLFLSLFTILGIFVFVIMLVVIYNIEAILGNKLTVNEYSLIKVLLFIMAINIAIIMPKTVFATLAISKEKFIFIKSLDLFRGITTPIISLILLYNNFGAVGLSIAVLCCTILDLLFNIYYCFKYLSNKFYFRNMNFKLLPGMFSFSFFIMLQAVMDQLNWQIGKLVLARTSGSESIAVYSVGVQINSLFLMFSAAILGVFSPQIYKLVQEKNAIEKLSELFCKVARFQYFIVFFIWISFVIFGKSFIFLWAGKGYINSYYVAILLMTPLIIALTQNIAIEILRAYNKHALWNIIHLIFAVVNFMISIPLAIYYKEIGTAIGTCITMGIVTIIIDNIYYKKVIKLDIKKYFLEISKILPTSIIVCLIGIILYLNFNINSWLEFFVVILVFSIIYLVCIYYFAFNKFEKTLIKNIRRR